jgi:hypothetical protein
MGAGRPLSLRVQKKAGEPAPREPRGASPFLLKEGRTPATRPAPGFQVGMGETSVKERQEGGESARSLPLPKPWNTALPQGRSPETDQGIFLRSSDDPGFRRAVLLLLQYRSFEGLSTALGNESARISHDFLRWPSNFG